MLPVWMKKKINFSFWSLELSPFPHLVLTKTTQVKEELVLNGKCVAPAYFSHHGLVRIA